jgi:hypothetical protein
LDLRENENIPETDGLACLKLRQIQGSTDETMIIFEKDLEELTQDQGGYNKEEGMDNIMNKDQSFDNDDDLSVDSFIPDGNDRTNYFQLALKPNRIYHFELTFTPLQPKYYKFRLPLTLEGYGRLES